jgi:hypothetical protein
MQPVCQMVERRNQQQQQQQQQLCRHRVVHRATLTPWSSSSRNRLLNGAIPRLLLNDGKEPHALSKDGTRRQQQRKEVQSRCSQVARLRMGHGPVRIQAPLPLSSGRASRLWAPTIVTSACAMAVSTLLAGLRRKTCQLLVLLPVRTLVLVRAQAAPASSTRRLRQGQTQAVARRLRSWHGSKRLHGVLHGLQPELAPLQMMVRRWVVAVCWQRCQLRAVAPSELGPATLGLARQAASGTLLLQPSRRPQLVLRQRHRHGDCHCRRASSSNQRGQDRPRRLNLSPLSVILLGCLPGAGMMGQAAQRCWRRWHCRSSSHHMQLRRQRCPVAQASQARVQRVLLRREVALLARTTTRAINTTR